MALTLHFAARSDVGLLRDGNEDSGYAGPRLLAVADGMGGHAAGEVASSVAVATLSVLDEDAPGPDLLDRLAGAVHEANERLHDMVADDRGLRGMGTTLTALLRAGTRFGLVHVGDSRAYLLRAGSLQQVTHDHTFVQSLVDEGRITAEEADHHPQRSLLTNALDGRDEVELDLSIREVRQGDRWLLCTDGLSGVVSEETLAETLRQGDVGSCADRLVELALRGGGPDNVTVIVADVVDVEAAPPDIPVVVGAARRGRGGQGGRGGGRPAGSAAGRAAALGRPSAGEDPEEGEDDEEDERPRRRWARLAGQVLLAAAVLAAAVWAAVTWAGSQYYVGTDEDGAEVAIHRGLSQNLLGLELSTLDAATGVPVEQLTSYSRRRLGEGIPADDRAAAEGIVEELRREAAACRRGSVTADPDCPEEAGAAEPTGAPTGAPTSAPTGAPTGAPTPAPTAGPAEGGTP